MRAQIFLGVGDRWMGFVRDAKLIGRFAPLLGEGSVGKDFDVDTADDRSGLEGFLLPGYGVVPIGEWDARGASVDPMAAGAEQRGPIGRLAGQGAVRALPG